MFAGQRTTPRTDRCTGGIIRPCTSAAVDGRSLTGKPVVSTVSNHKCLPIPVFPVFFVKWKDIEDVDSGKRKMAFPKCLEGRVASDSIWQLVLPSWMKCIQAKVRKVKRFSAHPERKRRVGSSGKKKFLLVFVSCSPHLVAVMLHRL